MIVTKQHLRTIPGFSIKRGFCIGGSRTWFARHGLDWRVFIRHGLPEEQFLATDALGKALVDWAHQCEAKDK